jgi:hypothetical protein
VTGYGLRKPDGVRCAGSWVRGGSRPLSMVGGWGCLRVLREPKRGYIVAHREARPQAFHSSWQVSTGAHRPLPVDGNPRTHPGGNRPIARSSPMWCWPEGAEEAREDKVLCWSSCIRSSERSPRTPNSAVTGHGRRSAIAPTKKNRRSGASRWVEAPHVDRVRGTAYRGLAASSMADRPEPAAVCYCRPL